MPAEFRQENQNSNPDLEDLWRQLQAAGGIETLGYAEFASITEDHHNGAHDAIGGDMLDPMVSPQTPIFWLLHAFYDHVFRTWEQLQARAVA